MKQHLQQLLADALKALPASAEHPELADQLPELERTRDRRHGDFASNLALQLAKPLRSKPRDIAEQLVAALPASRAVAGVEIAGPGFINFRLAASAFSAELLRVMERGNHYGHSDIGNGHKMLVEFVSANPTGPLHVGHGRHAAYGASVANLLAATGHSVHREYYVNDAGRQMDILALSLWLRLYELKGETLPFPANAYQGTYVTEIAEAALAEGVEALVTGQRRPV